MGRGLLLSVLLTAGIVTTGCGAGQPGARALPGRAVFLRAGCGSCHTFSAAGTRGRSGPDFDTSERLSRAQLRVSLIEGANGMPSYAGRLSSRDFNAVVDFLYAQTHLRSGGRTGRR